MKMLQSLLAVVQFVALGQLAFFGLLYKGITDNSDILPHIQDAHLHLQVATWRARTAATAVALGSWLWRGEFSAGHMRVAGGRPSSTAKLCSGRFAYRKSESFNLPSAID